MTEYTEYALAPINKNHIFPKIFPTYKEAEIYKSQRVNPDAWIIVQRKVQIYKWEETK